MKLTTSLRGIGLAALAIVATVSLSGCTLISTLASGGDTTPTPTPTVDETGATTTDPSPTETTDPTPTSDPTKVPGTLMWLEDIAPGECFSYGPDEGGEEFEVFSNCDSLHVFEMFAVEALPAGDFPGEDAILDQAQELCESEFDTYVRNSDYNYSFFFWWPSQSLWESGDRVVLCALYVGDYIEWSGSAATP